MFGFGKKAEEPVEEPQVTSDVPVAEAKAEGQKLEWGPDLGQMNWNPIREKISELNAGLLEGDNMWRLPTKDELLNEFKKNNLTDFGYSGGLYWSGSHTSDHGYEYAVNMKTGAIQPASNAEGSLGLGVRLVRDVS